MTSLIPTRVEEEEVSQSLWEDKRASLLVTVHLINVMIVNLLLIVWTFSKEWEEHYLSSWERTKCKVTDLNDDCGTSNCQQKDGMMIIIQDDGADCEDDDRNGRRWVESLFELGAASSPTVLRTQYLQTIPTLVIILVIVVLSAFSSLHSFRLTSYSHWKFSPPLAGSVWWGKLF